MRSPHTPAVCPRAHGPDDTDARASQVSLTNRFRRGGLRNARFTIGIQTKIKTHPALISSTARGSNWGAMRPQQPLVGVIMGSRSDWETMKHAVETLETLGVPYEVQIVLPRTARPTECLNTPAPPSRAGLR